MTSKGILIERVSKFYRLDNVQIAGLVEVNLQIAANRMTVLSGPSGSGKTTLLNLIGCIDQPDSGRIVISGEDTARLSDDARSDFRARRIGYVFQTFNLLPVLSALENVEYPLAMVGVPRDMRRRRAMDLLEQVGIADQARHRPGQLSGGQRQRVAIARALAARPAWVLADEPSASLDSQTGAQIIALMRRLQREQDVSFIVSSHDPIVLDAADDIVRIRDGRVVDHVSLAQQGAA
ncbi:ABC transporter ATP-binding protein [Paraburkholderia bannensis]|uniref:ABC transporter ATP-binding protein n=1 Tax=Paraburkholderia bannensis TaxID=765414 RepID=UPI00048026BD|nr:ABC transporter ATP-binding protein [Paraburkholderia bannensis]